MLIQHETEIRVYQFSKKNALSCQKLVHDKYNFQ